MFIETTATKKICALTKRIRFVSGGTSSSKTISILLWLIDYAQSHKSKLISIVSESLPHLKKGAIRDFQLIMENHNYWDENRFNKTDSIYTFETGSKIEFFSADEAGKVHGPRRDILYLNEANNIDFAVYTQLEIRTREIIWVDSNPTHEYWMYTEVIPHNDIDFITLTYKDNEALEAAIVQSIESKKHNTQFWQVYGLGQLGEAQGRIYKGWEIIDSIPHQARLERYGLDFGYSCLVGETMVETSTGSKRIDGIKEGDFVLTRKGYKKVIRSWSNGFKDVYDVDFGYGKRIIATGDHRIFTLDGWKKVSDLNSFETICVKKSFLKEEFIGDTQMGKDQIIFSIKRKVKERLRIGRSIVTFTQSIMERSLRVLLFTMKMGMRSIIAQKTLSLCQSNDMDKSIFTSTTEVLEPYLEKKISPSSHNVDSTKLIGQFAEKEAWPLQEKGFYLAQSVRSLLKRLQILIKSFAVQIVGKERIQEKKEKNSFVKDARNSSGHQHILSEKHALKNVRICLHALKEKKEVFDLFVEDEQEFFANGILVHNCDPTAIVAIYRYNGGFIFNEIAYRTGLSNRQIADIIKNQDYALVVADSAEPKSIDELKDEFDIDIVPCTKGPGSINQGIQYVQDQRISVTKSSTNLIKEYRNYLWLTDKNGKTLNIPQDTMNHCFVGSTVVETDKGKQEIKDLVGKHGFLLTKKGLWKPFKDVRATRLNTETVKVVFENGRSIEVTPDHLVLLVDGSWKESGLLSPGDLIQSAMYDSDYFKSKTGILLYYFYQIQWRKVLQGTCSRAKRFFTSVCLGKGKWANSKEFSCSPQEPRSRLQLSLELRIERIRKAFERAHDRREASKSKGLGRKDQTPNKEMAWVSGGKGMACVSWEENLGEKKAIRERVCFLPWEIFNYAISKISPFLPSELQDESQTQTVKGITRGFSPIVFNLEVEDTHCLVANGIIAHNCLDAIRYSLMSYAPDPERTAVSPRTYQRVYDTI